ncbi:uncharacterized protein LOC112045738 [Bicyclus anynana]|uniref:Uncharacterized protein LOC112045738 n=1 Tax=Bicyclus anynana TaxID=110368 RepID=A0A6J1MQB1_BICAN|nr:uncharacterized protein LOC112045738 [Bicyclus anynana]
MRPISWYKNRGGGALGAFYVCDRCKGSTGGKRLSAQFAVGRGGELSPPRLVNTAALQLSLEPAHAMCLPPPAALAAGVASPRRPAAPAALSAAAGAAPRERRAECARELCSDGYTTPRK